MNIAAFIAKWTGLFANTPAKNITAQKMREFTTDTTSLLSTDNIKTIEGQSLLGSGNVDLSKTDIGLSAVDNTSDVNKPISTLTQTAINQKQDILLSGTNIKTINGNTLLGIGNLQTSIPTLQEVTDAGNNTVTQITVNSNTADAASHIATGFKVENGNVHSKLLFDNLRFYDDVLGISTLKQNQLLSGSYVDIQLPASNGTIALIEDLPNNSYSTTETTTGGTWVDGKPIYRIVINTGDLEPLTSTMILSRVAGSYTILEYTKI